VTQTGIRREVLRTAAGRDPTAVMTGAMTAVTRGVATMAVTTVATMVVAMMAATIRNSGRNGSRELVAIVR
jgi:Na+-transporting NADH:ubiquinone oxidoreductase subunit NqrD